MKVNQMSCLTAVVLCAGGLTSVAHADSLGVMDLTYQGTGDQSQVILHYTGSNGPTLNDKAIGAGELQFLVNSATGPGSSLVGQQITAFCLDIWEGVDSAIADICNLQDGPVTSGVSLMGADRASLIGSLYDVVGFKSLQSGGGFSGPDSALMAGAFQLAIWEIVSEDGFDAGAASFADSGLDIASGFFSAEADLNGGYVSGTLELAQQMLTEAWNSWVPGSGTSLLAAGADGMQDIIIVIPLPQSTLMTVLVLSGVIFFRRRLLPA